MEWDHLAENAGQRLFAGWLHILFEQSKTLPLELATRHRPASQAIEASALTTGSYNICSIVTFEDGFKAVVRFPIIGRSRFRTEKINDELMIMQFLETRVQIPIPTVLGAGKWAGGPYMVSTYVEGTLLSQGLRDPTALSACLRPDVPDSLLEQCYYAMADIMLKLYKLPFPRIGAISSVPPAWKIIKRPMTMNMNELVRVGNYPPQDFPEASFNTASEYFQELARQQFQHLKFQRNDAVKDEADCKKKYLARCLFKTIAARIPTAEGHHRLYCDDFRPTNVIVASETDFEVPGVIDWEFTYAAPVEFSHAAPWWLLLESPEGWESDLHKFLERYRPRLELFLRAMRRREDEQIQEGSMDEAGRLSTHMEKSMDNGIFWFCLAARKSFMFDDIYWTFLDEMFFGPLTSLDDRLSHITEEERQGLDDFVREKMQQAQEESLDEHMTFDEIYDL
ncbi:phosphotransferase enzyme family protein [Xylariomycetidae sp. FL2044]|nr:phosphotransferase enzyme family protein [Xylariomycetidae sp. FL2044]